MSRFLRSNVRRIFSTHSRIDRITCVRISKRRCSVVPVSHKIPVREIDHREVSDSKERSGGKIGEVGYGILLVLALLIGFAFWMLAGAA